MSKIESSAGKALYEQQETKLSQQSAAFIELLTKRGILGDSSIDDDRVRQAKKEKKKSMYHNTLLLLQHYRTILWTLECFPSSVAEELDRPLKDLDTLLDRIDLELGMNNRKLEGRMESVRRQHKDHRSKDQVLPPRLQALAAGSCVSFFAVQAHAA